MMKVGFISLGCAKNLMDTEVMLHRLVADGFEIVPDDIDADVIVVVKDGVIAESGSHEVLLQQGGEYAKLYRNQFAGIAT